MLHNTRTALGTQNTLIDRMVTISFYIAYFAISEMNINTASAGTHITSGFTNLIRNMWRGINAMLSHNAGNPYKNTRTTIGAVANGVKRRF